MTSEIQQLVKFFRSEDGRAFGNEGDHRGWSPAETAIHFLKILAADSNLRFLKENVEHHQRQINRQIDDLQRRLNNLNTDGVPSKQNATTTG